MCQARLRLFRQTVHDSLDSAFELGLSKVYQEAETPVAQAQLSEDLFPVDAQNLFDGFQFDDHLVFHHQVGTKALIKDEFIIPNGDGNLAFDTETLFAQLMSENHFVNGFEQTRTGLRMNPKRRVEDDFG